MIINMIILSDPLLIWQVNLTNFILLWSVGSQNLSKINLILKTAYDCPGGKDEQSDAENQAEVLTEESTTAEINSDYQWSALEITEEEKK